MSAPVFPTGGAGSNPTLRSILRTAAGERFRADPSKCYQRHIREVYADHEPHLPCLSLQGVRVGRITTEEAKSIILKFEWLETMAAGTIACYGAKTESGELLGVACFGKMPEVEVRKICCGNTDAETTAMAEKTVFLVRGACVPWAPHHAASFTIRHACREAHKDFGWSIFAAYSDVDAGEIGTVYQLSNWFYLGQGLGRGKSGHSDFIRKSDGKKLTSRAINGKRGDAFLQKLGWTKGENKRLWMRTHGWDQVEAKNKHKYVWFEGTPTERAKLKELCRYDFQPYPKREKS